MPYYRVGITLNGHAIVPGNSEDDAQKDTTTVEYPDDGMSTNRKE